MNTHERIELFRKMAEADPENELAHLSLGKLYKETGAWAEAAASLERTLELQPEHAVAHQLLGEVLLQQGRKDEAVAVLERGVRIAHDRGEFMPRDAMRKALEAAGVTPPELARGSAPGGAQPEGTFVCTRCLQPHPPLRDPPFASELGRRIHESICQSCWREWMAMSIKVINEYRLNMAAPGANEVYENHLREFLGL